MFPSYVAQATQGLLPLLIAVVGGGGIVAGVVALLKLKPETTSMAVEQAQGAMETMQSLNEDLSKDRDYYRELAKERLTSLQACEEELRQARAMVRHFSKIQGFNGNDLED